jgi:hypothetical protein
MARLIRIKRRLVFHTRLFLGRHDRAQAEEEKGEEGSSEENRGEENRGDEGRGAESQGEVPRR